MEHEPTITVVIDLPLRVVNAVLTEQPDRTLGEALTTIYETCVAHWARIQELDHHHGETP